MLQIFRVEEGKKSLEFGCRPINLHAAYERRRTGPILVVEPWSAVRPVQEIAASQVQQFELNHAEIAKPDGRDAVVYKWVAARMEDEFDRLSIWQSRVQGGLPKNQLCTDVAYKPEV